MGWRQDLGRTPGSDTLVASEAEPVLTHLGNGATATFTKCGSPGSHQHSSVPLSSSNYLVLADLSSKTACESVGVFLNTKGNRLRTEASVDRPVGWFEFFIHLFMCTFDHDIRQFITQNTNDRNQNSGLAMGQL